PSLLTSCVSWKCYLPASCYLPSCRLLFIDRVRRLHVPDAHPIRPYLNARITALFCSYLTLSLRCYVTAGYPECLSSGEGDLCGLDVGRDMEIKIEKVGANSAV